MAGWPVFNPKHPPKPPTVANPHPVRASEAEGSWLDSNISQLTATASAFVSDQLDSDTPTRHCYFRNPYPVFTARHSPTA